MGSRKGLGWGASLPSVSKPDMSIGGGGNPLAPFIAAMAQTQAMQQRAPIELQNKAAELKQSKQIESEFLPQELELKARAKKTEKIAEEEGNRQFGAEKEATSSRRFVQQFERSFDEIHNKLPGFDQPGLGGKLMRLGAKGMNALDMLPETKAFQVRLKPIANQMARDVEGGKITDQDRQIYADAFANTLLNPSETNARLISEQLIGLSDKGGNISKNLEAFAESNNPVFQLIHKHVSEQLQGTAQHPNLDPQSQSQQTNPVNQRSINSIMPTKGGDKRSQYNSLRAQGIDPQEAKRRLGL